MGGPFDTFQQLFQFVKTGPHLQSECPGGHRPEGNENPAWKNVRTVNQTGIRPLRSEGKFLAVFRLSYPASVHDIPIFLQADYLGMIFQAVPNEETMNRPDPGSGPPRPRIQLFDMDYSILPGIEVPGFADE
jgi:hypothetical protein